VSVTGLRSAWAPSLALALGPLDDHPGPASLVVREEPWGFVDHAGDGRDWLDIGAELRLRSARNGLVVHDRRSAVACRFAGGDVVLSSQSGEPGAAGRVLPFCLAPPLLDAGALLVATVDRSSIAVGVADLRGQVLAEHHEAADFSAGPTAILDRLTTLFLWLMEEHGGKDRIWGAGLALPGPVEPGAATASADLGDDWQALDLAAELAYRIGALAFIRSGTEMMTVGELKAGDGARDMLYVKLGRSIGAGIVIGGHLHRGVQGAAGLIGHGQTSETSEVICRCGKRGCLESIVGSDAVARDGRAGAEAGDSRYLAEVLARSGEVTAADVANGAHLGDAFCADLAARCGRLVGESLAPFANLLNPSLIVIGGGMVQAGDILLAAVREAVYRNAHPMVTRDLRIVRSRIGGSAGLLGAAQVAAEELFRPETLQRWIPHGSPRRLPEIAERAAAARARHRPKADRKSVV